VRNFQAYDRVVGILSFLRHIPYPKNVQSLNQIAKYCRSTRLHLLYVLTNFRDREATGPRDRVYAAFGIAVDPIAKHISPAYDKPVEEVYKDFVKSWAQKVDPGHRLEFLGHLDDVTPSFSKSWAPD